MNARRGRNSRDGKGRKATSAAETRRGATRKDDEGRRGSHTAALNAVPSDRQHRLLHGSSARSLRASVVRCTIHARFRFLSFSFVLGVAAVASMPRKEKPASTRYTRWKTRSRREDACTGRVCRCRA